MAEENFEQAKPSAANRVQHLETNLKLIKGRKSLARRKLEEKFAV